MDAIEVLKSRRSVRSFLERPVSRDVLVDIVDCGRLAPSACNQQVWEFVVITDRNTRSRLAELMEYGRFLSQAAACIAVFVKDSRFYVEDGASATSAMLLAAQAHGLGSCWVSGDKQPYAENVRKFLGAPAEYKFVSMMALGYPSEVPTPPKRALEDVLHWEKF